MFLKNFIYKSFVLLFPVILLSGFKCDAQIINEQGLLNPSPGFNKKRFVAAILSESTLATIVTIGLQYLWYKKYPKTLFHFFNDNDEWLQMDKVGYATTTYNIAAVQYNLMRWSGVNKNRSLWIAGSIALAYMSMIEISDCFSAKWGFSSGDMAACIAGTALFATQQSFLYQQRIQLQFSFHHSIYAQYNPEELGRNFIQRMIKDYNG